MKIYYNSYFPGKSFVAINLFGYIVARRDCCPLTTNMKRHEAIHTAQMREMLYIPFYMWYGIEWLVRLVQYKNIYAAYFNISMEREAYGNDGKTDYLLRRKKYSWVKYLKKK